MMTLLGSIQAAYDYPFDLMADGIYVMCKTDTAGKIGENLQRIESGFNLYDQQPLLTRVRNIALDFMGSIML